MRFIVKPTGELKEKQELLKTKFDQKFLQKIIKILNENKVTDFDIHFNENRTIWLFFYDYESSLQAHLQLDIANIQHCYYQDSLHDELDFIPYIEIGPVEEPYDESVMSRSYFEHMAYHLGKRLLEFYDRCYIEKKIMLNNIELRQIDRDICFMKDLIIAETKEHVPVNLIYDYYFTATERPISHFRSDNEECEEFKYGVFTLLTLRVRFSICIF